MTSTSVVILSQVRLQAGLTFSPISPEPTKDQERLKACSESLQSELPIFSLKSPRLRKSPSHNAPPPWGSLAFSGLSTQAVAGDNLNDCLASACCQAGHLCSSTIISSAPDPHFCGSVSCTNYICLNVQSGKQKLLQLFQTDRDLKPRNDFEGVEGHVLEHEGAAAEMQLGDEEAAAAPGWGPGQHSPLDCPRCCCRVEPHPTVRSAGDSL